MSVYISVTLSSKLSTKHSKNPWLNGGCLQWNTTEAILNRFTSNAELLMKNLLQFHIGGVLAPVEAFLEQCPHLSYPQRAMLFYEGEVSCLQTLTFSPWKHQNHPPKIHNKSFFEHNLFPKELLKRQNFKCVCI